jgi:hypothetical protein
LYGRVGRLMVQNGGLRPGLWPARSSCRSPLCGPWMLTQGGQGGRPAPCANFHSQTPDPTPDKERAIESVPVLLLQRLCQTPVPPRWPGVITPGADVPLRGAVGAPAGKEPRVRPSLAMPAVSHIPGRCRGGPGGEGGRRPDARQLSWCTTLAALHARVLEGAAMPIREGRGSGSFLRRGSLLRSLPAPSTP